MAFNRPIRLGSNPDEQKESSLERMMGDDNTFNEVMRQSALEAEAREQARKDEEDAYNQLIRESEELERERQNNVNLLDRVKQYSELTEAERIARDAQNRDLALREQFERDNAEAARQEALKQQRQREELTRLRQEALAREMQAAKERAAAEEKRFHTTRIEQAVRDLESQFSLIEKQLFGIETPDARTARRAAFDHMKPVTTQDIRSSSLSLNNLQNQINQAHQFHNTKILELASAARMQQEMLAQQQQRELARIAQAQQEALQAKRDSENAAKKVADERARAEAIKAEAKARAERIQNERTSLFEQFMKLLNKLTKHEPSASITTRNQNFIGLFADNTRDPETINAQMRSIVSQELPQAIEKHEALLRAAAEQQQAILLKQEADAKAVKKERNDLLEQFLPLIKQLTVFESAASIEKRYDAFHTLHANKNSDAKASIAAMRSIVQALPQLIQDHSANRAAENLAKQEAAAKELAVTKALAAQAASERAAKIKEDEMRMKAEKAAEDRAQAEIAKTEALRIAQQKEQEKARAQQEKDVAALAIKEEVAKAAARKAEQAEKAKVEADRAAEQKAEETLAAKAAVQQARADAFAKPQQPRGAMYFFVGNKNDPRKLPDVKAVSSRLEALGIDSSLSEFDARFTSEEHNKFKPFVLEHSDLSSELKELKERADNLQGSRINHHRM
jgi:IgA-specific serine endopeptidase